VAQHFPPAEAARRALAAGCDALLVCSKRDVRDAVLAALERLPDSVVSEPARRLATLKARYSGGRNAGAAAPPFARHARLARSLIA
jgi:beta-glucosidase-like glycosyl hydrolase